MAACRTLGIHAYRGNEQGWIYRMEGSDRRNFFKRGLRFLDTYIDLFGPQTYPIPDGEAGIPVNIMGSRQLKPVSTSLNRLEKMRLRRILNAMTHAAVNGEIYHLWWHPHNFGVQLDENMDFLRKILGHFRLLQKSHHFESMAMEQLAADILENAKNGSKHEVIGSM
ncbi:hypothetical protein P5G51_004965 [Virgibacillus sp. 179-BFC.A HS]|uniref:Uncharacterized protein n=1 Tax=Tigheibacillus jepli TaxID=3035914 RepID=A0ABU5CES8_9BACI|nr:hypothetical protein [Virgibacillus sp. 179-BFC.A HS]MDY0404837.1 hypothetical protein [Virgibacillus sp. 179-BFC.A HS]